MNIFRRIRLAIHNHLWGHNTFDSQHTYRKCLICGRVQWIDRRDETPQWKDKT